MTTPRETLAARFTNDLTLHPPQSPEVGEVLDDIRAIFLGVGLGLIEKLPMGRDLSECLTHIEDASRWAVAAVVKNQDQLSFPESDT